MKKSVILSAFLLCSLLFSFGQTGSTALSEKPDRISIPDQIKSRKAFKRAEWFYTQRAFPHDTIPATLYLKEKTREIGKAKSNRMKSSDVGIWLPRGPRGINTTISNWGTISGRVKAVAVHPTDPLTVYIGAANGGLWKTTDGGENWQDIGHDLGSLSYGAIAIDPNNPEIIYAGSGEACLLGDWTIFPGNGLYKSTDGGHTWSVITNGFGPVTNFGDLLVSPYNSNIVIAALGGTAIISGNTPSNEGIWKSLDGGITWNRTLEVPDASDIAFHPADPDKVYAAAGGAIDTLSGFYISSDQGDTWIQSNCGLMLQANWRRMQFDISQSNPDIFYAVIYEINTDYSQCITRAFKSVNGGINWSPISAGTNLGGYDGSSWYDQGWYDLCIAVDPEDPNHVLIGNVELHRTVNGNLFNWVRPFGNNCMGSLVHVDYHKLVYAPSDPDCLYIGCDGGIYKSTDKGYTASSKNRGLETLQFYRIASHPDSSAIIMGGMQDNGSAITHNAGADWDFAHGADGMECFFDYINPRIIYSAYQFGNLLKSNDGGTSFSLIRPFFGAWITPVFMHPTDNNIIYGANKNLYKSTNGGVTFPLQSLNISPVNIATMAQSKVNPSHMIFGTGKDIFIYDTAFLVKISTDEGVNWTDVTANIPGETRYISRVVTDPLDANTMYVVRTGFSPGNKIWKTTDLGLTWANISGDLPNLPCSDLFIDPENDSCLYVANDIGVYYSADKGNTWTFASEGMPFVPAMDFDYVKIDTVRYLRVGTHGRSIYETKLSSSLGIPEAGSVQATAAFGLVHTYPNPNNSTTTIEYELLSPAWVKLTIYNHFGQQLEVLVNIKQAKGTHKIAWDAADLPAGIYYYQLQAANKTVSGKIIKIK